MDDRNYWLALNLVPGMRSALGLKLYKRFGSMDKIFQASIAELQQIEGLSIKLAKRITTFNANGALKNELRLMALHKVDFVVFNDEAYPELLRHIFDPPLVLYIRGTFCPQDKISLAIVGSRRPTLYGKSVAQGLASKCVNFGFTVVSGMARGIDSMAHKGALRGQGRTIAVLGSGLDYVYPSENKPLMDKIKTQGAVVSEFPMGTPPLKQNFPMRNRIISGMSLGVLIVEAGAKSGALITARLALDQGREVFAVPGPINSWASKGTNGLIKQGAKLVEDIEDIIEELSPNVISTLSQINKNNNKAKADFVNDKVDPILDCLLDGPKHIDILIEKTGIQTNEIFSRLIQLEMEGIIKQLPGGIYSRV